MGKTFNSCGEKYLDPTILKDENNNDANKLESNLIWGVIEVKENVKGRKISDEAAVWTIPDNDEEKRRWKELRKWKLTKVKLIIFLQMNITMIFVNVMCNDVDL